MTRMIDADAIDKRYVPIAPVIEGDAVHYEWVAFVEDINEQPIIDGVPVKRGEWLFYCPDTCICSECAFIIPDYFENMFRYCPNCGADMRGEK